MAITEFGRVIREYRDELNISLRQMAEEIGLSPTYVSAVEVGEKGITDDFVEKVLVFLKRHKKIAMDFARIRAAVDRTRRAIDVSNLDGNGRFAVAAFARKLGDLDRESREKLIQRIDSSLEGEE